MTPAVRHLLLSHTPILDLDFRNGLLDPRVTLTRSGNGSYFDKDGVLQVVGTDVARFDYGSPAQALGTLLAESARTNSIRNNTMAGAAAGTPGTLPTNWTALTNPTGVTRSILGPGVEFGMDYIDVRWAGTPGNSVQTGISFDSNTGIAANPGETWAGSFYARVGGGSLVNISSPIMRIDSRTSGGAVVDTNNVSFTPTSALARVAGTLAASAMTAFVTQWFRFTSAAGQAIDFTIRIYRPQMELGSFATTPIATSSAAVTRNADAASIMLPRPCDLLVQDRAGAEWRSGLAEGAYSFAPRSGQNHISRVRAYPLGSAAKWTGMAVAI